MLQKVLKPKNGLISEVDNTTNVLWEKTNKYLVLFSDLIKNCKQFDKKANYGLLYKKFNALCNQLYLKRLICLWHNLRGNLKMIFCNF